MALRAVSPFLVSVLLLSGCESAYNAAVKPWPWGMSRAPEGMSETFTKGWDEGCESALSVYGNGRYRAAYKFKQDFNLVKNAEYYGAWKDAWTYCRWYAFTWVRDF